MKLSETDNSWPVTVTVRDGVVSREMLLSASDALDGTPIETRGDGSMFKEGQVVRMNHRPTRLWQVMAVKWDGNLVLRSLDGRHPEFITGDFCHLVGNNYKPKDRSHV